MRARHARWVRRMCAWAVALGVVACSDAAGPDDEPDATHEVSLEMVQRDGPYILGFIGEQVIECGYRLSARGAGNASVSWGRAEFRLFAGVDRTVPAAVIQAPVADVVGGFGDAQLGPAETQTLSVLLTAALPFSADLVFFFRGGPELPEKQVTVPVSCEFPAPAGTPPPTIQSIDVTLPSSVTPGVSLNVSLPVQGNIRLWEVSLALTGTCTTQTRYTVGELEQTSYTFVLLLTVPATCAPGGPVRVRATVTDMLGRVVALDDDVTFEIVP